MYRMDWDAEVKGDREFLEEWDRFSNQGVGESNEACASNYSNDSHNGTESSPIATKTCLTPSSESGKESQREATDESDSDPNDNPIVVGLRKLAKQYLLTTDGGTTKSTIPESPDSDSHSDIILSLLSGLRHRLNVADARAHSWQQKTKDGQERIWGLQQ